MRISRPLMFMQMAEAASRRSTCFRRNVGCIIVDGHVPVSIGYNGPPSGDQHCTGKNCADPDRGCTRALHAEANAISRLPRGAILSCLDLYTTESPCLKCAELIIQTAPISSLYYIHQYRITEGIDLVAKHMPVWRITPAGHLINHATGELIEEQSHA